MAVNLEEKKVEVRTDYSPKGEDEKILAHLAKRIPILKNTKKNILGGLNFEDMMKEADDEYQPHFLRDKQKSKQSGGVYLLQDEVTGLRGSRVVKIESSGEGWRSDISEPTLLVKVQTALSILIDQNPEAVFKAVLEKYKPTTAVAQALWKRSWEVAHSKEQLKLFVFDLAKYGWAVGRTYPRLVQREGQILQTIDIEHPENNKYKKVMIEEFNDIYREKLDPYRTWIDDMTNLTDPWSMDDWYFELDFSKDTFDLQFEKYANHKYVSSGQKEKDEDEQEELNEETKQRDDMVTLGFYESKNKDLYAMYSPKDKVVLYHSPLPNDDKMLSLWWTYWNERDPRTPYGIGLYEILKGDKVMYDRLDNMTMDQLVLSVYQMFFYSGTNSFISDGIISVSPGKGYQKLPGTSIESFKFDFDPKTFEGIDRRRERMDENTGITPTLQGKTEEGKTLGEVLHAKDAALKRLNIPLSNIANALTTDAYLTLSWANQVYSLPEVKEFIDTDELDAFQQENGVMAESAIVKQDGSITADFPRMLDLSLDQDREGNLIEAPEARIFTVGGEGMPKKNLNWKGRITINVWSIIAPSQELERQRKLELFNLVMPVVQGIATSIAQGMYKVALALSRPVVQILEIQNEKPENWLPEEVDAMLKNPELAGQLEMQAQQQMVQQQQAAQPLFVDPNAPPEEMAAAPSTQGLNIRGVVPKGDITNPMKDSMQQQNAAPMMK